MGPLTPIIGLRLLALAAGLRHNAEIGQPGLCFSAYGHKFGINHLAASLPWRALPDAAATLSETDPPKIIMAAKRPDFRRHGPGRSRTSAHGFEVWEELQPPAQPCNRNPSIQGKRRGCLS